MITTAPTPADAGSPDIPPHAGASGLVAWYAEGFADLLGDRLCLFDNAGPALELLRFKPHVSTLPGFEAATWYGIYAPKGTPREAIAWLGARFNEAMQDTAFTSKLVEQGYVMIRPDLRGPDALAAHTRSEIELWRKVIADAKIPPN